VRQETASMFFGGTRAPGFLCDPRRSTLHGVVIGRLTGQVVADEPDGTVVLDVSGVGYELRTPHGSVGRAAPQADGTIRLFTHLHVREDILELYGFATEIERLVFRLLLGVPNVGPKTALGVLSALPPKELAVAVDGRDLVRLTRIDGVGKKTAERLVLELRERLPRLSELGEARAEPASPTNDETRVASALTNMGYRPLDAQRAVRALSGRFGKAPLADLIKEALALLSQ
jgi:holliday junction DNA helicase RuvA